MGRWSVRPVPSVYQREKYVLAVLHSDGAQLGRLLVGGEGLLVRIVLYSQVGEHGLFCRAHVLVICFAEYLLIDYARVCLCVFVCLVDSEAHASFEAVELDRQRLVHSVASEPEHELDLDTEVDQRGAGHRAAVQADARRGGASMRSGQSFTIDSDDESAATGAGMHAGASSSASWNDPLNTRDLR